MRKTIALRYALEIVVPMFGAAEVVWFIVGEMGSLRWPQLFGVLIGVLGLALICPVTETVWKRLAFHYGLRKEVVAPMNFGRLWPILVGVAIPFFRVAYYAPAKTMAEIVMKVLETLVGIWCGAMALHSVVRLQDEEKSTP